MNQTHETLADVIESRIIYISTPISNWELSHKISPYSEKSNSTICLALIGLKHSERSHILEFTSSSNSLNLKIWDLIPLSRYLLMLDEFGFDRYLQVLDSITQNLLLLYVFLWDLFIIPIFPSWMRGYFLFRWFGDSAWWYRLKWLLRAENSFESYKGFLLFHCSMSI